MDTQTPSPSGASCRTWLSLRGCASRLCSNCSERGATTCTRLRWPHHTVSPTLARHRTVTITKHLIATMAKLCHSKPWHIEWLAVIRSMRINNIQLLQKNQQVLFYCRAEIYEKANIQKYLANSFSYWWWGYVILWRNFLQLGLPKSAFLIYVQNIWHMPPNTYFVAYMGVKVLILHILCLCRTWARK